MSWNVLKTYCLYYYCVLIPNIVHCCISSVLSSLHWLHNYTWLWGKNTICKVLLFTIIAIIWIQSFHVHHHQKTQSDRSRSWPSVCLSFFYFLTNSDVLEDLLWLLAMLNRQKFPACHGWGPWCSPITVIVEWVTHGVVASTGRGRSARLFIRFVIKYWPVRVCSLLPTSGDPHGWIGLWLDPFRYFKMYYILNTDLYRQNNSTLFLQTNSIQRVCQTLLFFKNLLPQAEHWLDIEYYISFYFGNNHRYLGYSGEQPVYIGPLLCFSPRKSAGGNITAPR